MFGHITKPKIKILSAEELMTLSCYNRITGKKGLHNFGALHRLMLSPFEYAPTTFGLAKIMIKPVCVVTLTRSNTDSYILLSQSQNKSEIKFPNIEVMAYTHHEYRNRGVCTFVLQKILEKEDIPKDFIIYCYSSRMERMLHSLGYVNSKNLHEYTP